MLPEGVRSTRAASIVDVEVANMVNPGEGSRGVFSGPRCKRHASSQALHRAPLAQKRRRKRNAVEDGVELDGLHLASTFLAFMVTLSIVPTTNPRRWNYRSTGLRSHHESCLRQVVEYRVHLDPLHFRRTPTNPIAVVT